MCNGRSSKTNTNTTLLLYGAYARLCSGHDRGGALCGAGQQAAAVGLRAVRTRERTIFLAPAGPTLLTNLKLPHTRGSCLPSTISVLAQRKRMKSSAVGSSVVGDHGFNILDLFSIPYTLGTHSLRLCSPVTLRRNEALSWRGFAVTFERRSRGIAREPRARRTARAKS